MQRVDYAYNIRGWLTDINNAENLGDDLFAFKIGYDQLGDDLGHTIDPLYNGNIAETFWRSSSDNVQRKYSYQYDALNRLRNAIYQKPENTVPVTNMYNESMSYDKNGNITSLQRNGDLDSDEGSVSAFTIDELTYFYSPTNPNQLMKVDDEAYCTLGFKNGINTDDDYSYDDNGNMLTDKNKGITHNIRYNHLNLPVTIGLGEGEITYLYTTTGQKLKKEVRIGSETITTDYLNGFQYVNGSLQFFPTAEGYVNVSYCNECQEAHQMKFNYVYNYTDHLGNIRMSYGWDDNENVLKILEENHYYPFGLKHTNYNVQHLKYVEINPYETGYVLGEGKMKIAQINPTINNVTYKYLFQSQERQEDFGLNWDSFKYRNYDYNIGRFMNIDPLTEEFPTWSPYVFSGNRVVEAKELEGLETWFTQDGSQATRPGPWTSQARKELNLYSPSEVQQAKAKAANNSGPMLSQDRMSASDRKAHDIAVKAAIAEKEAINQTLNNHENLGSPYTAKTIMEGVAYGTADIITGELAGKAFQGLKMFGKFSTTEISAFSKIGSTGQVGEDALKLMGGESQVYMKTSQGGRYIDQLVDGIANESKVGYTTLTKDIASQIAKDAELLKAGDIKGATWHFFTSPVTGQGGASKPLLDELEKNGINAVIH